MPVGHVTRACGPARPPPALSVSLSRFFVPTRHPFFFGGRLGRVWSFGPWRGVFWGARFGAGQFLPLSAGCVGAWPAGGKAGFPTYLYVIFVILLFRQPQWACRPVRAAGRFLSSFPGRGLWRRPGRSSSFFPSSPSTYLFLVCSFCRLVAAQGGSGL